MQQRIHQGAAIAFVVGGAGSGVHRHARRLIHYSKFVVFEDDVQGNIFRHARRGGCAAVPSHGDAFPSTQPQRCPCNGIIHQHQLLRDELLDTGTTGFRKMRHQKLVQAFAGIFSRGKSEVEACVARAPPPAFVPEGDDCFCLG